MKMKNKLSISWPTFEGAVSDSPSVYQLAFRQKGWSVSKEAQAAINLRFTFRFSYC